MIVAFQAEARSVFMFLNNVEQQPFLKHPNP